MKLLTIALAGLATFAGLAAGAPSNDGQRVTRAPFAHVDTDKLR
jgi:hypothetical protein